MLRIVLERISHLASISEDHYGFEELRIKLKELYELRK